MDDVRFGRLVRVLRQRARLRQRDLAARAGVSASLVARIERGFASAVRMQKLRDVGGVLGIRVEIDARWRGGDEDRLLDAGHAAIVEIVIAMLAASGWETVAEYSFNHFGDRGSVDILAWHPGQRTLLIVEVKTRLLDLQNLLGRLDRKVRVVPGLVASERDWQPRHVARLVVVPEESHNRRVVARHGELFRATLPARGVEVRQWLRKPVGGLAGLWFLSGVPAATLRQRARVYRGGPAHVLRRQRHQQRP